ncbi:protein-glutamate methylesterase/protein-glutamine glutaminase [Simiduia agarivorans]|uniref:Protein-glutamate methylesterase/protein-glutamine glutaminase n=1 Tax=Simiduia agarivorans (strain DSM 21679 / JCM 13881 / BCRC 17597 / SA1) TaxID=1117647 RepID=K4KH99_SIMAS|nr:chemotaxis response regulator protein-glutamate methylesterase [Simiduia agarivorans]AFU97323.1 Chemotaxis response regulator protein-glutamate methylesterase CheB [Simiduia agarivorans SA1 = DSM 21679]
MKQISVIVVDDSRLVRELLTEIINADPVLNVVACAEDAYQARELIKLHNPQVITLDVEMPGMNGIAFLKNLMRLRPMPVLMVSTLTARGSDITLEALELGAVDYVTKPVGDPEHGLQRLAGEIVQKLKACARANITAIEHNAKQHQFSEVRVVKPDPAAVNPFDVIVIGASTGGTEAIKEILCSLPMGMPPVVLVQHLPPKFAENFARRLGVITAFQVMAVSEGIVGLQQNTVYLAGGDWHLEINRCATGRIGLKVSDTAKVNRHRPSVDVLFNSVAEHVKDRAIGVLLTGMGMDGAAGLGRMRSAGAYTLAQDKDSCVVWGMPRVAMEQGAVEEVKPLCEMAGRLVQLCFGRRSG